MIHWLDSLATDAAPRVGGKAAPLAALAMAGLPVPPGFVVGTEAYTSVVAGLPRLVAALDEARRHPPEDVAETLMPVFGRLPLPGALEADIREAYAALSERLETPEPAVAVRSSAVGEDGEGASFAGQQATYLNVRGADAVLAAIKACWAGLWSARAVGYRRRLGDEAAPAIAVLVQALVLPDVAGVAFTVNPVTGDPAELLIDASWGLGEAVVSGRVTPDQVIVERATGAVRSYMVGTKEVEVIPDGAGVDVRDVPAARRQLKALSPQHIEALAALADAVEARQGPAQDLEWAIVGEQLYLLQARPITGLPPAPPPGGWRSPVAGGHFERRNFAEHFSGPLSPLAETLVLPAVAEVLPALAREVGMTLEPPALAAIHGYAFARSDMRRRWDFPLRATATFFSTWLHDPKGWELTPGGGHDARLALLLAHPPAPTDASGLVAWAEAFMEQFALTWRDLHRLSGGWRWSEYALRWALGGQILAAGALLQGFDSPVFSLERRLYELGAEADADVLAALAAPDPWAALTAIGAASESFRARIERLCRQSDGLPASFDPHVPMPFEAPASLCHLVLASRRQAGMSPEQRLLQLALARGAAERQVLDAAPPLRRWLIRRLLPLAQRYAEVREPAIAKLGHGWQTFRQQLLALGAWGVANGHLGAPEDVFFLRWPEVRALVAGQPGLDASAIAERRATWEAQGKLSPPSMVGGATERSLGRAIAGVPASPGRVTGVARVIHGPADFASLAPGEILVAPATTPAWTPLFHLAAAIVTDVGGPLSHGSIVAREFRIPAVLGTTSATRRLKSGDVVTVDGDYGLVWLGDG
jgi:pyruvate,water dikinase